MRLEQTREVKTRNLITDCQVEGGVSLYAGCRENSSFASRAKYLEKMIIDNSVSGRKIVNKTRRRPHGYQRMSTGGRSPVMGDPRADYIWRLRQKDSKIQKVC